MQSPTLHNTVRIPKLLCYVTSWLFHLHAVGQYAEARPYYERALAISEQGLGPEHPDTALILNNLGGLLQAQGDLAGARLYFERALHIFMTRLGPNLALTQTVQRNLAALEALMNQSH